MTVLISKQCLCSFVRQQVRRIETEGAHLIFLVGHTQKIVKIYAHLQLERNLNLKQLKQRQFCLNCCMVKTNEYKV